MCSQEVFSNVNTRDIIRMSLYAELTETAKKTLEGCSMRAHFKVSLLPHSKLLQNSDGTASRNIKMFDNSNTPKKSYLLEYYSVPYMYCMPTICTICIYMFCMFTILICTIYVLQIYVYYMYYVPNIHMYIYT